MAEPGTDEGHGRLQITPKLLNMIYKLTTAVFVIATLVFANLGRLMHQEKKALSEEIVDLKKQIDELNDKNKKLDSFNDLMLTENASLVSANNELKFIKEKKPIIIYKHEKRTNVNHAASEQFNDILSKRYESQ